LSSRDHLISSLTLDSDNTSQIISVLNLDSIMEKHPTGGVAGVQAPSENQRPIPKIALDTSMLTNKAPAVVCKEAPSPTCQQSFSNAPPTDTNSKPSTSTKYWCNSSTQPMEKSSNSSTSTYYSRPFEDPKDERRVSIEKLQLGPLTEESVNILVESDGIIRNFLVHTELLCHFSPYFRSFFGKREPKVFTAEVQTSKYTNELDFESHDEDKIKDEGRVAIAIKVNIPTAKVQQGFRLPDALGDVKHAVFATFVDWLYLGPGKFEPKDANKANQLLIPLWVLAGRLGISSCQNDCIAAIEDNRKRNRTIATSMIGWVYSNTREYRKNNCGLKNLLVDQCALALDEKWFLEGIQQPGFAEQFPTECLFDIIARMKFLLRDSGLGEGSLAISPRSRRYWIEDGEGNAV